jgi:hypothetical protein
VITGVAAVALAAACSGGTKGTDASCVWRLSYGKRLYVTPHAAVPLGRPVHHEGTALGQGALLGCADGGYIDEKTAVYRIKGVDPSLAVVTQDDEIGVTDPRHLPPSLRTLLATGSAPAPS